MTAHAYAPPVATLRAAAYVRISDDRTGENASIARQKKLIRDLAQRHGIDPAAITWYEDKSKSASHGPRPEFEELLASVRSDEVDVILVWVADRLWRSDEDRLALAKALGAAKVSVRAAMGNDLDFTTAEGSFMADVIGAASKFEVKRKTERVRLAAEDRARKGRYGGGTRRFGYRQESTRVARTMAEDGTVTETLRPSGRLVLVPDEAEAIAWAYRHIATGGSLRSATKEWRARGLVGGNGAGFTPQAAKQVLLRPMNAGLASYKGEVVGTGEWPAITDPDTFQTVVALLNDPGRRSYVGKPATTLLSGILICSACGHAMRASGTSHGDRAYRCQSGREKPAAGVGPHMNRRAVPLDQAISDAVLAYVIANADKLTRPKKAPTKSVGVAIEQAARLRAQIEAYQSQADQFDPADLAALLRGLRAKLADAEKKLVKAAGRPATAALVSSGDVLGTWAVMNTDGKRTVIKELVQQITVGRGYVGRYGSPGAMHNIEIVWKDHQQNGLNRAG